MLGLVLYFFVSIANNMRGLGVPFEIPPEKAISENLREKNVLSAEFQTELFHLKNFGL